MYTFIGQMFPFIRVQDNPEVFLLIRACSPTEDGGSQWVSLHCCRCGTGSKASESHSVQILELGDIYAAYMSCAQHAQAYWHHIKQCLTGFKDSRMCVPFNPGGSKWQRSHRKEGKAFRHTDHLNTPFVASTQSQLSLLVPLRIHRLNRTLDILIPFH